MLLLEGFLFHISWPLLDCSVPSCSLQNKNMFLFSTYPFFQMLCAWDIREHSLVQMVTVKFPFSQRQPDFAPTVLSLLPSSTALTITCNEYIAIYRLGLERSSRNTLYATSHSQPVTTALYDPYLHQVMQIIFGIIKFCVLNVC